MLKFKNKKIWCRKKKPKTDILKKNKKQQHTKQNTKQFLKTLEMINSNWRERRQILQEVQQIIKLLR